MSWRLKIADAERAKIIAVHEKAWRQIEASGTIQALDFQAEHDRLGYILVELWKLDPTSDNLAELAITRFDENHASGRDRRNG